MFDRTPNLTGSQIINYRASPDGKWLVLIGIAPGAPEVRAASIERCAAGAQRALRPPHTLRAAGALGADVAPPPASPAQRPALVKGNMQLYSVEQQRSQALEAHAAVFGTLKVRARGSGCLSA